jgi:hypothetical protein
VVDGVVCFYNDDEQQFFEYKPLAECDFVYVSIADLRTAIANHDQLKGLGKILRGGNEK